MAGLRPPRRGDTGDERGQVLLVGAFSLAVAFVALSVVINGAIFTQNLATRGETAGSSEALHYRHQVERMVGELLDETNANYSGRGAIETELTAAIEALGNSSGYQQSAFGRSVSITTNGTTDGSRVYRTGTGAFTNATGAVNWSVATGVDNSRRFNLRITETGPLEDVDDTPFLVNVTGSPANWTMRVGQNGAGAVVVRTTYPDGTSVECTTAGTGNVSLNVTAGRLNGTPCRALDYADGVTSTSGIVFVNGDEIRGTYSLFHDGSDGAGVPNDDDVLYSATVDLSYETPRLNYRAAIRAAPGEPDG